MRRNTVLFVYQICAVRQDRIGLCGRPSPDSSGNPFVPGFGTKDCNG